MLKGLSSHCALQQIESQAVYTTVGGGNIEYRLNVKTCRRHRWRVESESESLGMSTRIGTSVMAYKFCGLWP